MDDIAALATVIRARLNNPEPGGGSLSEQAADAVISSDWLQEYVRTRVDKALELVEDLASPAAMGRAMWKSSGLNEDLIELAKGPAAAAVRAALVERKTDE